MINCVKMNGNGNDFLVMENMSRTLDGAELARLARMACRRREALGADGLLVLEPSDRGDFRMRLFNRDGSEGEMCGNGARCAARFALERGTAPADMTFETLGGDVHAVVSGERVTLDLAPVSPAGVLMDVRAAAAGCDLSCAFLTVGVPHTVILEEGRRPPEECVALGRELRNRLDLFPEGTNVNFASPVPGTAGALYVTTYERGVEDLTLSCGTGSAACAVVARLRGLVGDVVRVVNPGGENLVSLDFSGEDCILPRLEGRAAMIAEVRLLPEALR